MVQPKQYKLDMFKTVLPALDQRKFNFYSLLSEEEKKGYSPLVLMRAMSSLSDQHKHSAYEVLMVNDLVNIGFWNLTKHVELQHMLLCLAGLGSKQYHPWLNTKDKESKTKIIDEFLTELNPGINHEELALLRNQHDVKSIKLLAQDAGKSDAAIKQLVENAKKLNKA